MVLGCTNSRQRSGSRATSLRFAHLDPLTFLASALAGEGAPEGRDMSPMVK